MQGRNKKGQFGRKSNTDRKVRSIRVTDEVWEKLGKIASEQSITRADLLEIFAEDGSVIHGNKVSTELLKEALKLKANAGGAIKKKIREFLKLLEAN